MSHPNKHIREAIEYAEDKGWRFVKANARAHSYGKLLCQFGHVDCQVWVYSTPRDPQGHARRLRRKVETCPGSTE